MVTLVLSFFIVALLYATVGFGGGSSYLALLAVSGLPYELIPKIALVSNLLVVSGGSWHYYKNGHLNFKLMLPFVLSSVPMAFLGGSFPINERSFFILLTLSLFFSGIRILFLPDRKEEDVKRPSIPVSIAAGGILGLLSGMVGIGGGIFLSPLLINMGWARSKEAASTASMFILLNSMSGLAGQFQKSMAYDGLLTYLPLFIAVIIGGQIGSRISSNAKVTNSIIQKGTGILILFITLRLVLKIVRS